MNSSASEWEVPWEQGGGKKKQQTNKLNNSLSPKDKFLGRAEKEPVRYCATLTQGQKPGPQMPAAETSFPDAEDVAGHLPLPFIHSRPLSLVFFGALHPCLCGV